MNENQYIDSLLAEGKTVEEIAKLLEDFRLTGTTTDPQQTGAFVGP